jgi:hypothetical protein
MNKKYDNNNIIMTSRAYFLQPLYRAAAANDQWGRVFFRKRYILPFCGAVAANDQWGHLYI